MNQGLTSNEIKQLFDLLTKANDDQMRAIRSSVEGRQKERMLLGEGDVR